MDWGCAALLAPAGDQAQDESVANTGHDGPVTRAGFGGVDPCWERVGCCDRSGPLQ